MKASAPLKDSFRHIAWKGTALRILDQRRLPRRIEYIDCKTPESVARAITDMALRGAPLIGCAAAYGMALAARGGSLEAVEKAAKLLVKARPTAVNLAHAVSAMLKEARLGHDVSAAAEAYFQEDLASNRRMAVLGASLLKRHSKVLTHCNAGALATAGIGTAVGVIRQAFADGKIDHVYPCETRPYLQGSRLTLWELMREGIPATLLTDNMAAHAMKTLQIDAVIVGSDRIAANGDVCNKIGTYGLAILARHHGIPFYVAAPTTTVDLRTPHGGLIPIENRSAREVTVIGGTPIAPKGARAHHFGFDVTPHGLVTAIITEKGIIKPVTRANLRRTTNR